MARLLIGFLAGVVATLVIGAGLVFAFRGVIAQIPFAGTPELPTSDVAASEATAAALSEARARVEADDRRDFEFLERGFIATAADPLIQRADGTVIRDLNGYAFLEGEAADTVNPSLWRQARILTRHGLFRLSDRIYQVRGFDISTVSFIDAGAGWIVVDPLTVIESAAKAKALVDAELGEKPVLAVIYSHTHGDHFGGVLGIIDRDAVARGEVAVLAPEGFMDHAISENVIAGPAMNRRVRYQVGSTLVKGPTGEVTSGLGPAIPIGTVSLVAPTDTISKTGTTRRIGDLTLEFQVTPGTEAPAEMNFYLPELRAFFMAENANLTMHNLLPARGALVRDAKAWADYLTESVRLYGAKSDLAFGAHGVPRYGQEDVVDFLEKHRDAYKFLHDQSVRLMNAGLNGAEIAEVLELPEPLAREWYNRGYYGTMSHNSKAVYQRYMGWYDANPASLWPLPQEPSAVRHVEAMGGEDAVVGRADAAVAGGEYRWAATLLNYVIFANDTNEAARQKLAFVYTQLGYQAEAGTWRNIYLTGAQELRTGVIQAPPGMISRDLLDATETRMMLDFAAVRLNPERALADPLVINLVIRDRGETHLVRIRNGVLVHEEGVSNPEADATIEIDFMSLLPVLFAGVPPAVGMASGAIEVEGDRDALARLAAMIEPVDPNFDIVTP